ncbi:uncharacterized protein MELLADRAFT_115732 [Melampsora larici-populina 98AG31]|uniref:Uncharacterized protein n=1 Tax=Melampsora larici-populina (strain 98AG31 / pathotype 3-4-7) TaxID=747676 RepID=F4RDG1_MELLP|nr:uncharacterized protein MELLADRAFT_115732 [Melampsora larici-populina 98AG31]EGG09396.1 hypothetical protein MELLADRAFT_115732 [Melampsora larici-populina 98AG31]
MSTTTTSYSSRIDSNPHKKRSSKSSANLIPNIKSPSFLGKWKRRPVRTSIRLTAQEERETKELLRSHLVKKDFSLPLNLPAWSPPTKLKEEISPELRWFRDYSHLKRSGQLRSLPSTVEASDESNGADERSVDEQLKLSHHHTESPRRKLATETLLPPRASTSSSIDPYQAQPDRSPPMEQSGSGKGKPNVVEPKPIENSQVGKPDGDSKAQETTVLVNGKGKGKAPEIVIDWSDWKPHTYSQRHMAELRFKYSDRARELKRTAERQQKHTHETNERTPVSERQKVLEGLEKANQVATIEMVDSLLLFTQSFLCQEVDTAQSNISSTQRKHEFLRQWESMLGFFNAVKSFAKRSGIELAYGICLMYEGLLFHRLTETERSLLLQTYGHLSEPEQQSEAYKKFKNLLSKQESGKIAWESSYTIFAKLLESSSEPNEKPEGEMIIDDKNRKLPILSSLIKQMKPRMMGLSPELMSMDEPWRFCWPIDRFERGGMADFVAFARAGLDEWLKGSGTGYELERFDDKDWLFGSG